MKPEFTIIEYVIAGIKLGVLSALLITMVALVVRDFRRFRP
jgi:hypothetical protein